MPAKIEKIKNVTPEQIDNICIDTSFLLSFFSHFEASLLPLVRPRNPKDSFDCLEYLLKSGVLCCVSDFVIEEVYFKILQNIGMSSCRAAGQDPKKWKNLCELHPTLIQPAYPIIDKFNQLLDKNAIAIMDYEFDPTDERWLCNKANSVMQKFNITSNDAFIIAHGLKLRINNFLVFDQKWKDVDSIALYEW